MRRNGTHGLRLFSIFNTAASSPISAPALAAAIAIGAMSAPQTVFAAPPALFKKPAAAPAASNPPAETGPPAGAPIVEPPRVVATVNREEIQREELGKECLRHYGNEVLDTLINRSLIIEHCRAQNITVSPKDIQDEIDRLAKKFQLPTDQYLKLLEKERGVKPKQYASDVVWPTLALRRLAAAQLKVTKAELDQAYESQFGPAVKVRLIVLTDQKEAREVHALATAKPEEFGALARKRSKDANSASANGMIPPIRRFLGEPQLEDAAFKLRETEISPIVQVGGQFVILKCEGRLKAVVVDRAQVDPMLEDALKERKLRTTGTDLFKKLHQSAAIENCLNDPALGQQRPGVAAVVNQRVIGMKELTDECIERHGADVLDGTINRHLIEQTLRKNKVDVAQKDIDAEIARAAIAMGKTKKNGEADVQAWLDFITKQQGVTADLYIRDSVWPSVALKKIVGDKIVITEDDLKKGFEANFGERVRCRAIVLASLRKAQEVWDKARLNPSVDNFGKLAEEYSVEANSRALRGEVPPIQRFGGQPQLEKEAFDLEPGEISGIVQTGATFVILFCEGRTKPTKVEFKEVRNDIYTDLREKKLRIAMARKFEEMKELAEIDNFLAGTVHSPKQAGRTAFEDPSVRPASAQGKNGRTMGTGRSPDMSVDELIRDSPTP